MDVDPLNLSVGCLHTTVGLRLPSSVSVFQMALGRAIYTLHGDLALEGLLTRAGIPSSMYPKVADVSSGYIRLACDLAVSARDALLAQLTMMVESLIGRALTGAAELEQALEQVRITDKNGNATEAHAV